uniref:Interferon induced protein 44f3 n=1 Tax=Kryptolebias marmoratus TaxID=37003 RepID=A0A3Q3EX93_KRYMA
MSALNSKLTRSQQKTICSQLGSVKLKLLHKASVHGFTGPAFHNRCDNHCPTVSVGYNVSGYVFGGYTRQAFSQTGQYANDDQAFLFTFSGEQLLKYPVTNAQYAKNPFFVCRKRNELMESIKTYKPIVDSVPKARVLMIGPVGAGKSSFFNSINSVFRGHITSQAISGCFRTYSVKAGRGGKPLPIILCDTMGLEEGKGAGLDIDDINSILKGHLPDLYQFNPAVPLHSEAHGYQKSPGLKDKIHCVVYVIDAGKISIMPTKLEEKLEAIRRKVNLLGIPQLVLLTKVDEACPLVKEDLRNIYNSGYIKDTVSARLGVPLSCVVPVKNYSEELELDMSCDILLLSAEMINGPINNVD